MCSRHLHSAFNRFFDCGVINFCNDYFNGTLINLELEWILWQWLSTEVLKRATLWPSNDYYFYAALSSKTRAGLNILVNKHT